MCARTQLWCGCKPHQATGQVATAEPPKKYIILPDAKKAERRTPTPPLEEDAAPIPNLDEVKDDFDDSKLPRIEFTENAIKKSVTVLFNFIYNFYPSIGLIISRYITEDS